MTIKRCDRCAKDIEKSPAELRIEWSEKLTIRKLDGHFEIPDTRDIIRLYDLCEECRNHIIDFLAGGKEHETY